MKQVGVHMHIHVNGLFFDVQSRNVHSSNVYESTLRT